MANGWGGCLGLVPLFAFDVAARAATEAGVGVDAAALAAFEEPAVCWRAATRAGRWGMFVGQVPAFWLDAAAVNCGHGALLPSATPKGRLEARLCRARPVGPEGARSAGFSPSHGSLIPVLFLFFSAGKEEREPCGPRPWWFSLRRRPSARRLTCGWCCCWRRPVPRRASTHRR